MSQATNNSLTAIFKKLKNTIKIFISPFHNYFLHIPMIKSYYPVFLKFLRNKNLYSIS